MQTASLEQLQKFRDRLYINEENARIKANREKYTNLPSRPIQPVELMYAPVPTNLIKRRGRYCQRPGVVF